MTPRDRPRTARTPARMVEALADLHLAGVERVLELGCGSGHAAQHLLEAYPKLAYTALDRSITAVTATRARNAAFIAEARLSVVHASIVDLPSVVADDDRFDVIFAVNVNVFWTTRAHNETTAVTQRLDSGGELVLMFNLPDPARAVKVADRVRDSLALAPELLVAPPENRNGHLTIRARLGRGDQREFGQTHRP